MDEPQRPCSFPDNILEAFDFAEAAAEREREHEEARRVLLLSLLDVMDSFDRWRRSLAGSGPPEGGQRTVELIARQLESVLASSGVTPIETDGRTVDPERHRIVEVRDTASAEHEVVVETVQRGYLLDGRLLRSAQVVVSRKEKKE